MKKIISELVQGTFGKYIGLTFYQTEWHSTMSIVKLPTEDELPSFLHSYHTDNIEDAIGIWFEEKVFQKVRSQWSINYRSAIISHAKQLHEYRSVIKHSADLSSSLNSTVYHDFILKALQAYLRSYDCDIPKNIIQSNACAIPYPLDGYQSQMLLTGHEVYSAITDWGRLLPQILSGNYNYIIQSRHNEYENGPLIQLGIRANTDAERLLSCMDYNLNRWKHGFMCADGPDSMGEKQRLTLQKTFTERVNLWRHALKNIAAAGLFSLFRKRLTVFTGRPNTVITGLPEDVRLHFVSELNAYFQNLFGFKAVVESKYSRTNNLKTSNSHNLDLLQKVGRLLFPECSDPIRSDGDYWLPIVRKASSEQLYENVKRATDDNSKKPGVNILKKLL